jgi:hypothetical protein
MNPTDLLLWGICAGLGWLLFASVTGADEWIKSLFGNSQLSKLDQRINELETRLNSLENK